MANDQVTSSDPDVIDCPHCNAEHADGVELAEELGGAMCDSEPSYKRTCESCGKDFWVSYTDDFGGYYRGVGQTTRCYEIHKEEQPLKD